MIFEFRCEKGRYFVSIALFLGGYFFLRHFKVCNVNLLSLK